MPLHVRRIPCDQVQPNPHQPRAFFDDEEMARLAASIANFGMLQPIVVRVVDAGYELVAGERRLRACQLNGAADVDAVVLDVDADASMVLAVVENVARTDLNVIEEGRAYRKLMRDLNLTQEQVADLVSRSRARVSHALAILHLHPEVQTRVASGELTFGHARELCGIKDPYAGQELAKQIVAEGLTVLQTKERILAGNLKGAEDEPVKRPRGARSGPVRETDVEQDLDELFSTRVKVERNAGFRGRVSIEFSGKNDLDRILQLLYSVKPSESPEKA